jgi:mTERF
LSKYIFSVYRASVVIAESPKTTSAAKKTVTTKKELLQHRSKSKGQEMMHRSTLKSRCRTSGSSQLDPENNNQSLVAPTAYVQPLDVVADTSDLEGTIAKIVAAQSRKAPRVGRDAIRSRIEYLQASLNLNSAEVRHVFSEAQTLLERNTQTNIQPKLEYLKSSFPIGEDLKKAVLHRPHLLKYSLEKRIRPRMEAILTAGLDPYFIVQAIMCSEDRFVQWICRSGERKVPVRQPKRKNKTVMTEPARTTNKKAEEIEFDTRKIFHWKRQRRIRTDQ